MMRTGKTALVLLFVASLLQTAHALRCDRRIVSEQDSVLEVLARCGEPALRDFHPPVYWSGHGFYGYPDETWYYNFGPRRLLYVLRFRNNRLVRIDTDGHGFLPPAERHCLPGDIGRGMSKLRLLATCGEPVQRNQLYLLRPQFQHGDIVGHVGVLQEAWLYNFGRRRLLREVILEDGEVTEVKTGTGHGY